MQQSRVDYWSTCIQIIIIIIIKNKSNYCIYIYSQEGRPGQEGQWAAEQITYQADEVKCFLDVSGFRANGVHIGEEGCLEDRTPHGHEERRTERAHCVEYILSLSQSLYSG